MSIPSQIGQYRILHQIGTGGMGFVFVGEHTLLGRRAAIKTLQPSMSANHEVAERFFNEARATSAISEPGVIQIFDFGYHIDGTAYIVMELLEGETLATRIARLGRLPLGDALRIARQIAGSLAAAHAHDIIHRDLKPENIFLVHDSETQGGERSKILDFGICKVGVKGMSLTQSGTMIGTPVYMSPEQCRGAGEVDHRTDIYAFGCLVFHMVTGRPPFVGNAPGDLIVAHLRENAPPASRYVPELPLEVDAMLMRCLAKSPDDRFASMAELWDTIGNLCNELDAGWPAVASTMPMLPRGGPANKSALWRRSGDSRLTQPLWPRLRSTPETVDVPQLRSTQPMTVHAPRSTPQSAPAVAPRQRSSLPLPLPPGAVDEPLAAGSSPSGVSRVPLPAPPAIHRMPIKRLSAVPSTPVLAREQPFLSSAGFRAEELEETTTRRPWPTPTTDRQLAAPSARDRGSQRSRRSVLANALVLGCIAGWLATSLDDRGATAAGPAAEANPTAQADVTPPGPVELPLPNEVIEILGTVAAMDEPAGAAGLVPPARDRSNKPKKVTAKPGPRSQTPALPQVTEWQPPPSPP